MNLGQYFPTIINDRKNIESLPNYNIKYICQSGLCNQIYALINRIIKGYNTDKSIFVIDSFIYCIDKSKLCIASNIFDYQNMSTAMSEILGKKIYFIDRTNVDVQIISAKYGLESLKTIDFTDLFKQSFTKTNFSINSTKLKQILKDDPLPGVLKKLYLKYKVGTCQFEEIYDECNINLSFDENTIQNSIFKGDWYDLGNNNKFNISLFNKLLLGIRFSSKIISTADYLYNIHLKTHFDYAIHLRIEDDAINFWSKINKLDPDEFREIIYKKYVDLIQKYSNGNIFVLINDTEKIDQITKATGKSFYYLTKEQKEQASELFLGLSGREINGIIDLLVCTKYSFNFIGCHNLKLMKGSTFSYVILQHIIGKKILIDLDNIKDDEQIY
ncbi:GDP-fucose domain-containing protein [Fadolivirus algeromassiliense]|jgi:hypothetical protein|uniref:GDP-fucose domain-containing protein n=1 Tax=Fadolivirus FV1/VV64 TaxID=3070911 RepID=A0A7D3UQ50_9VIRU|nr:GDP-fucose domain-containing protein [Fadolivirus algeromassiliense]QKF93473.1 GDP-fucose domain-containing protein [Fadolivirus FV1/VV64]